MLRFFSKFKRLHKAVFIIFGVVLVLGLIAFYAMPGMNLPGTSPITATGDGSTVIARVGTREITLKEYRSALESLASTFQRQGNLSVALIKNLNLDTQAMDRLIEEKLALSEADKMNLSVTDAEVAQEITSMPGFTDQDTGKFIGREEYIRSLRLRGQTVEEFENGVRDSLLLAKVRSFLGASAQVSDAEIEAEYRKNGTSVDLVYATIDAAKIRDKIKFSDEELKSYYDSHKEEFKTTDAVRKVEYVFVPTELATKTVPITEEELKKEYEERKQLEPRASIIKLNVLTPADEGTVKAKIDDLTRRAKGAENAPPEDFAALAKGNSQDPSASKGGDIGFIKKDPNRSGAWQQRAYGLKVGDIDGPFRDGTSWYLMKVTEERQIPFAEMRPTLEASLKNRKGYIRASEIADKVYEEFTKAKDINQALAVAAAELKAKPETLLRKTEYFKKGDTLPEIGSNPTFEGAVEPLKAGEIAVKIGIPNGLAVPRVIDVKEPGQQLTFEDARFQVDQKLRSTKEPELLKQKAQEIAASAKTAADLEGVFKKEGLDVKKDTNFNSFTFQNLQLVNRSRTAALALKAGEVSKNPIKNGASWIIFGALKRTDADMSRLANAAERSSVRGRLLDEVQNVAFDSYVKTARKRYEGGGQLKINQGEVDKFFNEMSVNPADTAQQK